MYQILKAKATRALGTSLLIIPELRVLVLTKRHVGSGNEIGSEEPLTTMAESLPGNVFGCGEMYFRGKACSKNWKGLIQEYSTYGSSG